MTQPHEKDNWIEDEESVAEGIAVVGMAGRFPQAASIEELWNIITEGQEAVSFIKEEDDPSLQEDPSLKDDPNYVPAGAFLQDVEMFDANFFGYNAREAQVIDPQQRLFLEAAWEALERAGYDSYQYDGRIGVFAGSGTNFYFRNHILPNKKIRETAGNFQLRISNDNDYIATRVSYKLNLKGPSFTVQTGCSTSLTAISLACQSLLSYQSDMALAGGVSVVGLEKTGYMYEPGSVLSPDGHCRTFDAKAGGTVPGNGLGIVVLKRLEDALADGDQIYAVIKSTAVNNDGEFKMGFTAPSVEGQSEAITEAIGLAGIDPESISYIEAHGTATNVGDPIEITGLTQAFRSLGAEATSYCAIGSVKTNIGHLDVAAGVTGLIKTSLMLKNKVLVPSLNYETPNPMIDFESSPFFVNTELREWPEGSSPRRAGISSFGLGGTNVHAILEEAPQPAESAADDKPQLLVLSAKTRNALDAMAANLADHLEGHPEQKLADIAYTLHVGRRAFNHRRIVIGGTHEEIAAALRKSDPKKVAGASQETQERPIAFLFPGQGVQFVNMGRDLYESEPVYRDLIDECAVKLQPHVGLDLREILFPAAGAEAAAEELLKQIRIMQVALFVTEYAMAKLLEQWNITPAGMIGHSLGEFVAACLAGVMTLDDALFLVAKRGQYIQETNEGAMLSVALGEADVLPLLVEETELAAINSPELCVVAGTQEGIRRLADKLEGLSIENRILRISAAGHSWMMEPASERFREAVSQVKLSKPSIPYVSCITGTWITDEEATSVEYWASHLRKTVRFADGVRTLIEETGNLTLEIGPGKTLSSLIKQQSSLTGIVSIQTMRHAQETQGDREFLLFALGRLWLSGLKLDIKGFFGEGFRHRLLLPTYPFERRKYWIPRGKLSGVSAEGDLSDELPEEEDQNLAEFDRSHLMSEYLAPRNDVERQVVDIWQEYLGVDQIGVLDNFFELGGHSLLGIKMMKKTRELFQIELSERRLYEYPTVAEFSEAIEQSREAVKKIELISRDQPIPASWTQKRIYEREMRHPGESYCISIGFELTGGEIDLDLFEQSLAYMIGRHEPLRTVFAQVDGELVQVIQPPFAQKVPFTDLRDMPLAEREPFMLDRAYEEECQPFDLHTGPLFRMSLYRIGDEHYAWFLSGSGTIWDGISMHLMMNEMHTVYGALKKGEPVELPELPVQFADYTVWEQERYQGEALDNAIQYWATKFDKEVEQLDLPTTYPRTDVWYGRGAYKYVFLSKELGDQLKALSSEHGATLYMTMLGAFKVLFNRYTGQEDICVETSFANRAQSEVDHLVASLANFVGLRTDLSGDPTFVDVIGRARETVLGAIDHQNFPFAKAMEVLRPEHYANREPYFRMLITYHTHREFHGVPGLQLGRRLWARRALFDMYFSISDYGDDGIVVSSEYNTSLYDLAAMERIFSDYAALLQDLANNPNLRVSEVSVHSMQEA